MPRSSLVLVLATVALQAALSLPPQSPTSAPTKQDKRETLAANESLAILTLRKLMVAEIVYQDKSKRFSCSLADLADSKETLAIRIGKRLDEGTRDGYVFRFSGCGADRKRVRMSAEPKRYGVTGTHAFCANETGIYARAKDGKAKTCFANLTVIIDCFRAKKGDTDTCFNIRE